MRIGRQLCGLMVVIVVGVSAATAQTLNPTVTLLPEPAGTVPPECVDPSARPVQRAEVEPDPQSPRPLPAPQATVVVAPATAVEHRDVRSALRSAHDAAAARDRAGYDAALAAAKAMVPAGGADRELANDVLAVFADVTRLWDYQLVAPIGSFFDSSVQGGSLLRTLTAYRGYEEFVRRQIIVDANGTRFYPTRESIDFLLGLIANRLGGGGASVARRSEPRRGEQPRSEQPRSQREQAESPAPQPRVTVGVPQQPARREEVRTPSPIPGKTTSAQRTTTSPRRQRTQQPSARRPASTPAAAPEPSPVTPSEEPPLPPGVVATPVDTAVPTDTATATTTVADQVIDTAVTTEPSLATDTAAAETAPAPQPQRRSIILPIVLILIGVGVLIVLFRASS